MKVTEDGGALTDSRPTFTLTDADGGVRFEIADLTGHEAVSELFEFHLELLTPSSNEDHGESMTGREAIIRWLLPDGSLRTIHGLIRSFTRRRSDSRFDRYAAILVPSVWKATQIRNCRVFQQMTVPEIIQKILSGSGAEYRLQGKDYKTRAVCIQYMESNFAFAQRLMEDEGIHFYFDHGSSSHLVISDTSISNPMLSEPSKLRFSEATGETSTGGQIDHLATSEEMTVPNLRMLDRHFQLERARFETTASIFPGHPGRGGITERDWPGFIESFGTVAHRFDAYNRNGTGDSKVLDGVDAAVRSAAGLRGQMHAAAFSRTRFDSDYLHLAPGFRFELTNADSTDNGVYFITRVEHRYYLDDNGRTTYRNRFEAIRNETPFRPSLVTPRPAIHGAQSAVVVGHDQANVFVDPYGRVRVRFHWQNGDDDNSCWVRVAQPWAGNQYGELFTPRVGHEVLVGFVDGDPDQPTIVASLYNANNLPPYALPTDAAVSGYVSHSLNNNATSAASNHLLFVDAPDNEQLRLHSESHAHVGVEQSMVQLVGWGATSRNAKYFAGLAESRETSSFNKVRDSIFGSEQWQAGCIQKVKGVQHSSVFGSDIDVTLGSSHQFVVGAWSQAHIGAGVAFDIGFRTDVDVGAKFDLNIAPRFVITVGNQFDRVTGSRFVKTGSDHLVVAGGDYIEEFGGRKLTLFNGNVTQRLIRESSGNHLTYDVGAFKVLARSVKGTPDETVFNKAIEEFTKAENAIKKGGAIQKWGEISDGARRTLANLRDKHGISLVSNSGNLVLAGLHTGHSVTFYAQKINVVGWKITIASQKQHDVDENENKAAVERVEKTAKAGIDEIFFNWPQYAAAKAKVESSTVAGMTAAAIAIPSIAVAGQMVVSRTIAASSWKPGEWGL